MAHVVEPLLAITQGVPVEAQFLEKSNDDLVALKDNEQLMFFGFSDPCRQAPNWKKAQHR